MKHYLISEADVAKLRDKHNEIKLRRMSKGFRPVLPGTALSLVDELLETLSLRTVNGGISENVGRNLTNVLQRVERHLLNSRDNSECIDGHGVLSDLRIALSILGVKPQPQAGDTRIRNGKAEVCVPANSIGELAWIEIRGARLSLDGERFTVDTGVPA